MTVKQFFAAGLSLPVLLVLCSLLAAPVAAQGAVTIDMVERGNQWLFEPNTISVPAGQVRLTFRNSGQRLHNFVIRLPSGVQRTPDVSNGRTHEQAFTRTSLGQLLLSSGFRSLECYEDTPVVHGVVSALRFIVWKAFRGMLRVYLAAETGNSGGSAIFTQNLLAVAVR